MEDDITQWKELNYSPSSFLPTNKKIHIYTCEECNYNWEVTEEEPDIDEDTMEDVLVEDMFSVQEPDVCPMCGSSDCTER